jgi:uncharacterized protein (DUF305 family)
VNRAVWLAAVAACMSLPAVACVKDKAAASGSPADQHATADGTIPPGALYTKADVEFMQGMIAHHAQAIEMSKMAVSHGARPQIVTFTLKIDLSQRAEIDLMQLWLRDRNQTVPDTNAHHHHTMPGMLTAEQMKQLDAAKGPAFDKLFLELMILHHEGAIKMVDDLFAANGGQEPEVYTLATDIKLDQTAEIEKMREMLGGSSI